MTTGEVIALIKALSGGGGSGGGVLVVTDTNGTLDKTAGEIFAAAELGGACIKNVDELPGGDTVVNYSYITQYAFSMFGYRFAYYNGELVEYNASSADDYPVKYTE